MLRGLASAGAPKARTEKNGRGAMIGMCICYYHIYLVQNKALVYIYKRVQSTKNEQQGISYLERERGAGRPVSR
jgi:hypothetical protein